MKRLYPAALAAMLAVCLAMPAAAQVNGSNCGSTINGQCTWNLGAAYLTGLLPLASLTDDATAGKALLSGGAGAPAWSTTVAIGITPATVAATADLTAAQVNGGVITNYGQGGANTMTLPAAAAGYNCIVVVSTAGAGAVNVKAGASDKIYLDGTALDDGDKAALATPAVGNMLTCLTFQTGASAYDWICTSGGGSSWTDGGA